MNAHTPARILHALAGAPEMDGCGPAEGLADGHLTAAEGRALAREADQLVRERVVPLRRVAEAG